MPPTGKQKVHLKKLATKAAAAAIPAAAPAAQGNVSIFSVEGRRAFATKWASFAARSVEAATKGLSFWMREDHTSGCCDKCREMEGAPGGWLSKSWKLKNVPEKKAQLELHGIRTSSMITKALHAEIDKLVSLKAKVLQRDDSEGDVPQIATAGASGSGLCAPSTPPKPTEAFTPAPKRPRREVVDLGTSLRVDEVTPGGPEGEGRRERQERKALEAAAYQVGPGHMPYEDPKFFAYLEGDGIWPQRRREGVSFAIKAALLHREFRLGSYQSCAWARPSKVQVSDRTDTDEMDMVTLGSEEYQMALRMLTVATLRVSRDWLLRGHDALRRIRAGVANGSHELKGDMFPHFYHKDGYLALAGDTAWSHRRHAPSAMTCLTETRTGIHVWARVVTKHNSPCLINFPELVTTNYQGSSQAMDPDNSRLCVENLITHVGDDLFARVIEVHDGDAKVSARTAPYFPLPSTRIPLSHYPHHRT